ncbi:MAG: hypothetical protein HYY01_07430 [Chloroflexi bacterium]|nr:hypothetical protein [Chloroflexota bacterium]
MADSLSSDLLKALTEHEPQIGKALAGWQSSWSDFQQARRTLAEEARNLLKHYKVADEMAVALAPEAVNEVL